MSASPVCGCCAFTCLCPARPRLHPHLTRCHMMVFVHQAGLGSWPMSRVVSSWTSTGQTLWDLGFGHDSRKGIVTVAPVSPVSLATVTLATVLAAGSGVHALELVHVQGGACDGWDAGTVSVSVSKSLFVGWEERLGKFRHLFFFDGMQLLHWRPFREHSHRTQVPLPLHRQHWPSCVVRSSRTSPKSDNS